MQYSTLEKDLAFVYADIRYLSGTFIPMRIVITSANSTMNFWRCRGYSEGDGGRGGAETLFESAVRWELSSYWSTRFVVFQMIILA